MSHSRNHAGSSPVYREPCSLIPINLHDTSEFENLIQQRKLCGWNYSPTYIAQWRDEMDAGEKTLFWITLTSRDNTRAGHISLDSLSNSAEPEIKNSDKSIMTIKTFFILNEYQSLGLGRFCMDVLEDWATKEPYGSPNCKSIVVDTLTKRYWNEPEMKAVIHRMFPSREYADLMSAQLWYERRGYVQWKEIPKYQETGENGEDGLLIASFLRKDLQ